MAQHEESIRSETIIDDDRGRIDLVTVDFETKRNSLTRFLSDRLADTFEALSEISELRAVVLTGAGDKAFISGANLQELAALTPQSAREFITAVHRVCHAIRGLPVPVIARINGYCLGAGLEIAASCDLRLAAANAAFGMPEVKVGLPSVVEAALLPRLVGWGKAAELVLLARSYTAEEAVQMGLVEKTVSQTHLDSALQHWLDDILAAGPNAIRAQKSLLRVWEEHSLEKAVEKSIEIFAESYKSTEPKSAIETLLKC